MEIVFGIILILILYFLLFYFLFNIEDNMERNVIVVADYGLIVRKTKHNGKCLILVETEILHSDKAKIKRVWFRVENNIYLFADKRDIVRIENNKVCDFVPFSKEGNI